MDNCLKINQELLKELSVLKQKILTLEKLEKGRKQIEKALRESEENFRISLEESPLGIHIVSKEGETLYLNRMSLKIFGYDSVEEWLSTPVEKRYTKESYAEYKVRIGKISHDEDYPHEYGVDIIRKDGTIRNCHVWRNRVVWNGEKHYQVIFLDITDRKRVEKKLLESEHKVWALFDQAFHFIAMMAPDGKLLKVNRTGLQFAGIQEEDCLGKFFWDTPWWTHSEEMQNKLHVALAEAARGEVVRLEVTHPDADGSIHYIDFSLKPVKDENGHIIFLVAEGRDITERKQAEEDLRSTFRAAPIAFCILKDRVNQNVNKALCKIFGYPESEIIGRTSRMLYLSDEEYERVGRELYASFPESDFAAVETKICRKDGAIRDISVTAAPLLSEDSSLRTIVTIEDITDRKLAEEDERRRIEAENFRHCLDVAPMGVRIVNIKGETTYANRAILDILGVASFEELKGTPVEEYYIPESYAEYLVRKEKIQRGEEIPREHDLTVRRKDGSLRHFHVLRKDMFWNGEKQFQIIYDDITERIQAEIALKERTKQLEELNKELESFSYSVSHDLRAPLRAIDGYSRIILRQQGDKFDPETTRYFNMVRENTKNMGQLIEDILTFSRLGSKVPSMSGLDMEELTEDVWREFKTINSERAIDLKINPLPTGLGDRSLIKQVLINIISNAIKFTRNREIAIIEIGGFEAESENEYYVRDNGIGFDMRYHDKLFDVFHRLHSADYEGTGIGMAIVRRIINRHGGRVWAESKVNGGACFYFSLPKK